MKTTAPSNKHREQCEPMISADTEDNTVINMEAGNTHHEVTSAPASDHHNDNGNNATKDPQQQAIKAQPAGSAVHEQGNSHTSTVTKPTSHSQWAKARRECFIFSTAVGVLVAVTENVMSNDPRGWYAVPIVAWLAMNATALSITTAGQISGLSTFNEVKKADIVKGYGLTFGMFILTQTIVNHFGEPITPEISSPLLSSVMAMLTNYALEHGCKPNANGSAYFTQARQLAITLAAFVGPSMLTTLLDLDKASRYAFKAGAIAATLTHTACTFLSHPHHPVIEHQNDYRALEAQP